MAYGNFSYSGCFWRVQSSRRQKLRTGSIFRPKIDHEHIIEHRPDDATEGLVLRVGDISVPVFLAFECHDETMGEAFVSLFLADVGAPFERCDLRYLLLEGLKGFLDLF